MIANKNVILISQVPLPYAKIGSWTTMYHNYLTSKFNLVDYIICPEPTTKFRNINYSFVKKRSGLINSLLLKFKLTNSWKPYFLSLKKLINHKEQYIIKIIDN